MQESHGRQLSKRFHESCWIVIPVTFLAVLFITSAQAQAKRRCQVIADGVLKFGRFAMTAWLWKDGGSYRVGKCSMMLRWLEGSCAGIGFTRMILWAWITSIVYSPPVFISSLGLRRSLWYVWPASRNWMSHRRYDVEAVDGTHTASGMITLTFSPPSSSSSAWNSPICRSECTVSLAKAPESWRHVDLRLRQELLYSAGSWETEAPVSKMMSTLDGGYLKTVLL